MYRKIKIGRYIFSYSGGPIYRISGRVVSANWTNSGEFYLSQIN